MIIDTKTKESMEISLATYLNVDKNELYRIIIAKAASVNINDANIQYLLKFTFWGDALFWLFFLAFFLKTLVGLIWNYFTRKYILYKRKVKKGQEEEIE